MRIYHEEGPNEVGRSPDDLPKGPGKAGRSPDGFAMRRSPDGFAMRIYHEEGPKEVKSALGKFLKTERKYFYETCKNIKYKEITEHSKKRRLR